MKHKLYAGRRILACIYDVLYSVLLYFFFCVICVKQEPRTWDMVYIAGIFALSWVIREMVPYYFLMEALHLILVVPLFFPVFTVGYRIFFGLLIFHNAGESVIYNRRGMNLKKVDDVPWVMFLTCLIIYIYGAYVGSGLLKNVAFVFLLVLLLCYLLIMYAEGIDKYIGCTADTEMIPLKNIIRINSGFVITFLLIFSLCFFVSRVDMVERLFNRMLDMIVTVVKYIGAAIYLAYHFLYSFVSYTGQASSGADMVKNERSRQASGYVGENFDVLLYFIMTVLALYLMYRLIRWLLKRVMARRVRTDIVEKADMSVDYDVEKKNVFQRIKEQLSLEERFRKIYRYAVMNYRYDITLKAQMTTRDIDTAIEQTTDEDFSHVSDVYRRVRYGRGRAGVKEMSELNRAIRKIKR